MSSSQSQLVSDLKEEMRATVDAAVAATIAPAAALDPAQAVLHPSTTLQQRQLAEFNQWLYRWNNYQQHLANYWQGRAHALHQPTADQGAGGGKVGKNKKGKKGKAGSMGDKVELKWNKRFQELVDFKEEHGHCNVPKEFSYKFSPPLGHWVGRMRHLHKTGRLDPSRSERLLDVGFEFVIAKTDSIKFSVVWDSSFQALQAFKDVNGHVEVPKGYRPQPDASELDGWITRQRKHFKDGKLPDHLKTKLQALGLNLGGRGRPFGLESEESWGKHIKDLTKYCQDHGDCDVPEKYLKDRELGIWVKMQRDAYSDKVLPDNRVKMLNQIGFNFYHGRKTTRSKTTDPWQRRLSELSAYKNKAGNTNVPKNFTLNLGLGDFVYNQRMAYKDNNLSGEKIQALEDMGFDWTLKAKKGGKKAKTAWEKKFEDLQEFKSKYGNLNIPEEYEPDPKLGDWTKRQRKNQREGVMKSEKYEPLKGLGFDFGGPKQDKKPWMKQYDALVEFKNEHGHIEVPVHYEKNPPLYYWLGTQRQANKKGKLPENKVALLNELNFDFTYKPRPRTVKATRSGKPFLADDEWENMFHELEEWKTEHGNSDVPQRSGRLGSWVHYMRFYSKGGKLSQDRRDRLDEIGFCWNVTDDRWMAKYQDACNFKTEHGNFDVPASHSLYNWISYQRKLYQDASLPQDRVELLSKIDFDYEVPPKRRSAVKSPEAWTLRYEDLIAFKDEYGHCGVPPTYGRNPPLAKWVASQRTKNKKGNLRDDRLELLNEIGFDFGAQDPLQKLGVLKVPQLEPVSRETYLENMWDKSYLELDAYKNHFGHCNIPISYEANPALGAWAFSQRMAYKKDKLSENRIKKLNELGFSFGPQKKVQIQEEV